MILTLLAAAAIAAPDPALVARVDRVLAKTPIIDGHNDLPEALKANYGDTWGKLDLKADSRRFEKPLHTDIGRLRQGRVGGQFWSVWINDETRGPEAIRKTLEQIDIVRQIVARYPETFEMARTAADVRRIEKTGKIASLIGVEGGGQFDNSLATLRQYRALGAAYVTLTHNHNTDWADSANDDPKHGGLTPFGKAVVKELNRLGMFVDLSHVAPSVMRDAIAVSTAPVIFSHSSARALNGHPRNVPDDVLRLMPKNGGVVMVNFSPGFLSEKLRNWNAAEAAARARAYMLNLGQPDQEKAAWEAWKAANPAPRATLSEAADHIDHVARVAGHDHVGIGSDFDGITDTPDGLTGVETYPALFAELARRGWSDADLAKLAGGNILRAMEGAEVSGRSDGERAAFHRNACDGQAEALVC